jgi:hypothetical protein
MSFISVLPCLSVTRFQQNLPKTSSPDVQGSAKAGRHQPNKSLSVFSVSFRG